jgi:uncharacterized SAM-binding protein YcdF (DUF218 family)
VIFVTFVYDKGLGVAAAAVTVANLLRSRAMTVAFLLLLLAAAAVLSRLGRRGIGPPPDGGRTLFVLAVVLTLTIGYGPVPTVLLKSLQSGYPDEPGQPWKPRAAIIVLSGGAQRVADTHALQVPAVVYGRVVKGLELYRQCKRGGGACVVVVSGGDPLKLGESEATVYAGVLERIGVDPADLIVEGKSLNTWQNAQLCAAWLAGHPQDEVMVVTSGVHVRRSILYFSHFGIHAQGVRADYVSALVQLLPQAYNFLLTDVALHEYAGLLRYHVYELLGLNSGSR